MDFVSEKLVSVINSPFLCFTIISKESVFPSLLTQSNSSLILLIILYLKISFSFRGSSKALPPHTVWKNHLDFPNNIILPRLINDTICFALNILHKIQNVQNIFLDSYAANNTLLFL